MYLKNVVFGKKKFNNNQSNFLHFYIICKMCNLTPSKKKLRDKI